MADRLRTPEEETVLAMLRLIGKTFLARLLESDSREVRRDQRILEEILRPVLEIAHRHRPFWLSAQQSSQRHITQPPPRSLPGLPHRSQVSVDFFS